MVWMTRRLILVTALCVAAVMGAGSCGGDDDSGGEPSSDASSGAADEDGSTPTPDATAKPGGPQSAEETAQAFYEAWRAEDHEAAQEISEMEAHTTLFATPGADADWTFQGCEEAGERIFDCAFSYEGGSAQMRVALTGLYGWRVLAVSFTAD